MHLITVENVGHGDWIHSESVFVDNVLRFLV